MSDTRTFKFRLSHAKFYQLCEWLKKHSDLLAKEAPPIKALAKTLQSELGCPVPESAVYSAISTCGLTHNPKLNVGKRREKTNHEAIERIGRDIGSIANRTENLEKWVFRLAKELGSNIAEEISVPFSPTNNRKPLAT